VAIILSACGGSSSPGSASMIGSGSSAGGGSMAESAMSPALPTAPSYDAQYTASSNSGSGFYSGEKTASAESATPEERKVIRNASLEIMAQDASALYKSIVDYGAGIGGYEHSYNISNYETYTVIHAEFKVPPGKLGDFVSFIGDSGEIINSSMNSEDITDSFYDAETRLGTKRKSLDRYYALLAKAASAEEIVYVQRIIDQITEDIEALEGRLRLWNSQVNMATVSLYIRQINDPIQIRKEINWNTLSLDDMGYLIKRGFFSVTNTFISILQWLVIFLIGYSPLWIILAVGVLLWFTLRKRIKNKRESNSEIRGE
jgi:hypothetical protein